MLNQDQFKIYFARDDDEDIALEDFENFATYLSLTIRYINQG
jgi:hypothetical protein